MKNLRPGLNPVRLAKLMNMAIERCELDLRDCTILTEAASCAWVVTPVLAALAGAKRVYALSRSTRYGTIADVSDQTLQLARLVRVVDRIQLITEKSREIVSQADIVTNTGHVRPIDATTVAWMKPTAVVSLMYEAWEFRPGDVDLVACLERSIPVAGSNERHPAIDAFSYLGIMAIKLCTDAGVAVWGSRILLLCDNEFRQFIKHGLARVGAVVDSFACLSAARPETPYDGIVIALRPRTGPVLSAKDAAVIASYWPGAVVAQFWGDVDRDAFLQIGVPVWPAEAPAPGHMGIFDEIGPEPVLRLATGGLKVGEILSRERRAGKSLIEIYSALEKAATAHCCATPRESRRRKQRFDDILRWNDGASL